MSVLENMFEGTAFFENVDFRKNKEYRTLSSKLDDMEKKFSSQLSESQVEQFEEISNIIFSLSDLENKIVFKTAVSYAIQFMGEVYNLESLQF